jgi:hypothetical protein
VTEVIQEKKKKKKKTAQLALLAQAHELYQKTLFTAPPTLPELVSPPPPVGLSHRWAPTPRSGFATRVLEVNCVDTHSEHVSDFEKTLGLNYKELAILFPEGPAVQ